MSWLFCPKEEEKSEPEVTLLEPEGSARFLGAAE